MDIYIQKVIDVQRHRWSREVGMQGHAVMCWPTYDDNRYADASVFIQIKGSVRLSLWAEEKVHASNHAWTNERFPYTVAAQRPSRYGKS